MPHRAPRTPDATALVVDDEPAIRLALRTVLERDGWRVVEAGTVREALAAAAERRIDLYLVDMGLPDEDGLTLIRALHAEGRGPVMVLSARAGEQHKVRALDAGADDYLTKPFGIAELGARVRALTRRSGTAPPSAAGAPVVLGELLVDAAARRAERRGVPVHLTAVQWRLLDALLRAGGHPVPTRQLLREVWGPGHEDDDAYLRVYVHRLRRLLEDDPSQPRRLLNAPGLGYRLVTGPPTS